MSRQSPSAPPSWEGHYIQDGVCVACGHDADDLERFSYTIPPIDVFVTGPLDMPRATALLMGRMQRTRG